MMRIDQARPWVCIAPALIMLALSAAVRAQPPHAVDPLPNPLFSIDPVSPTIGPVVSAADVLDKPGPAPVILRSGLGLSHPLDDIDGLSSNRLEMGTGSTFALLFSVDRASEGGVPPDPGLVSMNRPFNVMDQAAKHQAAADLFMTTRLFDFQGPILDPFRGPGGANNTAVINQGDAGGVDYDLKPSRSASSLNGEALDEVDAIDMKPGAAGALRGGPGANDGIFFSLSRTSPSLLNLPGVPSGANIFLDFNPTAGGNEILYASAQQLGLTPGINGDDIDGLLIVDNGDGIFMPGTTDRIFFTLTRESPSLGTSFSPADILMATGGGFVRWARFEELGLASTDHVDALDILITDNIEDAIFRHALLRIVPGDFNHDGLLSTIDCDGFVECFSGPGQTFDTNGVAITTVDVGPGPVFNPPVITIETGDTVSWVWADGPHNVVSGTDAPDGAFSSGAPTSVAGTTFTVAFDDAFVDLHPRGGGVYNYFSAPNLADEMRGKIIVRAAPCGVYDMDFDGDVDCADWRDFKQLYMNQNDTFCLPLDIPEFVAVLLDFPSLPVHRCIADMNDDGQLDAGDVRPYVIQYLATH